MNGTIARLGLPATMAYLAVLLLGACDREAPPSEVQLQPVGDAVDEVVARVGDQEVTADALRRAMIVRGAQIPGRFDGLDERRALLDELLGRSALAAEARAAGFEDDPEVREAVNRMLADKYWRERIAPTLEQREPGDEEVAEYYEANRERYGEPARSRASAIFLAWSGGASEEEREALRSRAEAIREEALTRAPELSAFAALARAHSQDPTSARRGGDMGWLPEGVRSSAWPGEVVTALFALEEPGEVSPVVESRRGVYVLRLRERKPGRVRPLEAVEEDIRMRLRRALREEQLAEQMEALLDGYEVEVYENILERVGPVRSAAESPSRPPSFPVGGEES